MRRILIFVALTLAAAGLLCAQNGAAPMPLPELNGFVSSTGVPLAGAYLCSFAAGTTTPQATWSDATGLYANPNPVVLDVNGRASVWVKQLGYQFVLYVGGNGACPGTGIVQWSQDHVYAIFQQVGSLNGQTGSIALAGTSNQVVVTTVGTTITLSLPQAIATGSSPTFANLTATGTVTANLFYQGGNLVIDSSGNVTSPLQVSGATFTNTAASFTSDATGNTKVHNLTITGTCTGCAALTTQAIVTSSRVLGTVYQNTGTGPLMVAAFLEYGPGAQMLAYTDLTASPTTIVAGAYFASTLSSQTGGSTLTFWVMPNAYYKVAAAAGAGTIQSWVEWH